MNRPALSRGQVAACVVAIVGLSTACGPSVDPADARSAPGSGLVTATPAEPGGQTAAPTPAATAGTPTSQTTSFVPTRLVLPSGAVAPVDPAGVAADGVLEVPDDANRVGWWTGGARAGEPFGSVVVAGHVDSREYGIGIMSELLTVELGDEIVLGDGANLRRFQVSVIKQAPRARLAAETEAFRQDVDNRLVLITCVGVYNHAAGSYADNLVVIADEVA